MTLVKSVIPEWLIPDRAYRSLFRQPLFVAALRTANNGGWALGDERFRDAIAAALGRRVAPLPPGRPRQRHEDR